MEIDILEGHGTFNFKVEWQSVDGRNCLKWHGTFFEAKAHANSLVSLGRTPKIWGMVEDDTWKYEE